MTIFSLKIISCKNLSPNCWILFLSWKDVVYWLQVTIDLGKDAEFHCTVTGQPTPVISWTKDALPLREGLTGRTKILGESGTVLRISSITRDDKGMYQCFSKNDYEMVQATAELRLGGEWYRISFYNCFSSFSIISYQFHGYYIKFSQ